MSIFLFYTIFLNPYRGVLFGFLKVVFGLLVLSVNFALLYHAVNVPQIYGYPQLFRSCFKQGMSFLVFETGLASSAVVPIIFYDKSLP